ncbi:MAG: hypothetical protein UW95_C0001G0126 [Parcubacteria group bacterium GW2011_GWC1_45_14]|nr:MAG: hypothetical protein UW95_C0001G0126 [Parcubacteria group bacterium GW2011_GWC1_45_14]
MIYVYAAILPLNKALGKNERVYKVYQVHKVLKVL